MQGNTEFSYTSEKDSQGVLKEILQEGKTKDHTTEITIFKSMKCVKVLNFKCLSDNLCTECRSIKRNSLKRQTVIEMNSDHLVNEMPCAIEPHQMMQCEKELDNSCTDDASDKISDQSHSENLENMTKSSENQETLNLCDDDHDDLMKIMGNIVQDSNCPPRIMQLLLDQQRNLKESTTGRRWSKEIIRLCLTMWCRSPRAYGDLRSSGFLLLP